MGRHAPSSCAASLLSLKVLFTPFRTQYASLYDHLTRNDPESSSADPHVGLMQTEPAVKVQIRQKRNTWRASAPFISA
eukprot:4918201-Pleurochrysis_carterae.AAC.2